MAKAKRTQKLGKGKKADVKGLPGGKKAQARKARRR